jgi:hypothetical protein
MDLALDERKQNADAKIEAIENDISKNGEGDQRRPDEGKI